MTKKKSVKVAKKQKSTKTREGPTIQHVKSLVVEHAPKNWEKELSPNKLRSLLVSGKEIEMIVLAADIRHSTLLMKEAVDFKRFAMTIGQFVDATSSALRNNRGWFDKFTGDGFLAYWILDERNIGDYIPELFGTCHSLLATFKDQVTDAFRSNSRNFPKGIGLSLGIDGGPGHIVTIGGSLTVVGSPVVGAARMVSGTLDPYETLANVYLGEVLYDKRAELLTKWSVKIDKEFRESKEYKLGQEVYPITFLKVK